MREAGGTACSGGRLACRKPGILPGGTSPRIPKASGYLSMAEQPGVLSGREIRTGVCTCRFAAADAALNGSQDDCRYAKHLRRHGVPPDDTKERGQMIAGTDERTARPKASARRGRIGCVLKPARASGCSTRWLRGLVGAPSSSGSRSKLPHDKSRLLPRSIPEQLPALPIGRSELSDRWSPRRASQ